jgi:hypothetical protein
MPRYYFDIQENGELARDEEGLDLPDLRAAEVEAAQSLASVARDMPPGAERHQMAIEVRTEDQTLFKATFVFERLH